MSPDEGWVVRYSTTYLDQLVSRRFRAERARIDKRLQKLLEAPADAAGAERLRHQFLGFRSAEVFAGVRLIYRLCGECRRLDDIGSNPLPCCSTGETEDRTVNILCLSEHYADIPGAFEFDR